MIQWMVCDDHEMMRGALVGCVNAGWPNSHIVEAANYAEAWAMAALHDLDIIISDLVMPGALPLDGIKRLMIQSTRTPILVVTGNEQDDLLIDLFDLGIAGFVPKTSSNEVIELAIRLVLAGDRYIPQRVIDLVTMRSSGEQLASSKQEFHDFFQLTERQIEVLRHIAVGCSTKEIARNFALSPATIKTHTAAILAILGATNRTDAVVKAQGLGII
jgi:DNA-binding NarL/FixJ family response regulator